MLTAEREQKSLDAVRVVPVGDPSPCIDLWGHGNHGFLPSNSEGIPAFVSHHHEHGVYPQKNIIRMLAATRLVISRYLYCSLLIGG